MALIAVDKGVICSFGQISMSPGGARFVGMKPGHKQFTVMPSFTSTGPAARIRPTIPYLLAVYKGFVVM